MAASNGGFAGNMATRGRCAWLDGDGDRPSAVDSDRGGNCVAAVFLVVDGRNLCAINVYLAFTIRFYFAHICHVYYFLVISLKIAAFPMLCVVFSFALLCSLYFDSLSPP
jgi:hypothetical protein